jgi:hypothetical protein
MRSYNLLVFLFLALPFISAAENITGEVVDHTRKKGLGNVTIVNIYSSAGTLTDSGGRFKIMANKGELIEFRKLGYNTVRIRIPQGNVPPYFKIVMQHGPIELPEHAIAGQTKDWKTDSLRYYQLYKNALEFPELTGLDIIQHPFSAMSKRNRQIWAFQKEYAWWEQQKYIDYTFNEKLVAGLTGLKGDSVQRYMRLYRPTYEELRSMSEYTFYDYVKQSVDLFRHGRKYKPTIRRSAN